MKVILTQDVAGVGEKNDVVTVAGGYGRNFLIPRDLAKPASPGGLKELEVVRRIDERKNVRLREEAEKLAEKLKTLVLRVPAKSGVSGRLFGSVTTQEIAERLTAETGVEVDRRKVELAAPIRSIGSYPVPVTIFKGVTTDITVEVFSEEVVEGEGPEEEAATVGEEAAPQTPVYDPTAEWPEEEEDLHEPKVQSL